MSTVYCESCGEPSPCRCDLPKRGKYAVDDDRLHSRYFDTAAAALRHAESLQVFGELDTIWREEPLPRRTTAWHGVSLTLDELRDLAAKEET